MKILTKEEEDANYYATVRGGLAGGAVGLAFGGAAVYAASARFHTIRHLTIPMKTFLVTSSATFAAILSADRASRNFEDSRGPARKYQDKTRQRLEAARASESLLQRAKGWTRENRYSLVGGGWLASMLGSFYYINRDKYLTGQQKLVQARVVAQGVTVALIVASAALELGDARKGEGRYETVMVVDPNDPEHKHLIEQQVHEESYEGEDLWKDMVEAEEKRMRERRKGVEERERRDKEERILKGSPTQGTGKSMGSGKEGKDRILKQVNKKAEGSEEEIEEREMKKLETQKRKEAGVKSEAVPAAPADDKIADSGEFQKGKKNYGP